MGRHTLQGNPPIDITLRHSARAKRLSLRVSRLDGRVTLTLPKRAAEREGIAFLQSKEDWLRHHLKDLRPIQSVTVGGTVLYQGEPVKITTSQAKGAQIGAGVIVVRPTRPVGAQVKAILRHQARDALAVASDTYAARLGRSYSRLTIRDTRSRWGSCSAQGVLMYSWRLIMAPPAVLDYVAAHEVAHLVEMNHQPEFWAIVAGLCPNYRTHRQWLRDHGDQLHRIRFDD